LKHDINLLKFKISYLININLKSLKEQESLTNNLNQNAVKNQGSVHWASHELQQLY